MAEKGDKDELDFPLGGVTSDNEDELNSSMASTGSEEGHDIKKRRTQTPSPRRASPFSVPASPPQFMTMEELIKATAGVKNMSLAHEIAVDANFKIAPAEKDPKSFEKQVEVIMHKAFWDVFLENINQDPPNYNHALVLIGDVQKQLFSVILPNQVRLKAQITEVLDLDLIKQKMENDAFDLFYYSNYVINIMAKLCSPERDEKVAHLREIKEPVPLFKEIFQVLDLMKMDMANFTIQQIRPYLQQQSVEYERTKFQQFIKTQQDAGIDGLELTKLWLKGCFDELTDEANTDQQAGATPSLTPASVLNEAYMELLNWDRQKLYPETLVMDQSRFTDLQDKTSRLTLVASILLVTYNTVGAAIAGVQTFKEKLKSEICVILDGVADSDLSEKMTNVAEQINKSVREYMPEHGFKEWGTDQQTLMTGQIKQVCSQEHPVYKLVAKRLKEFIKQIISKKHTQPLQMPVGFSVVEAELGQVCGQFLRLISHNRSVFFAYYSDIINTLLQWKTEDLSPRG
ncbi:T-complex protein 11-like protein 1 [Mizuhopecten yessoensis]|uniref:T-complex protein 11-like protein 1 n=1 Tax=Mizuhopecten yessoensis TaxID=6573 RepID=A0A210Q234_MIZYE|nr:T-complex protein 11-like protein 1 [Mizuhopecten yessoensis]XP_021369335.1 T-complex protein 11-like protein 1 [Mizuhopecten yessoensis]OWF42739.1 T-complex protein 11-like protein 1 [Mizuhopecten yessoensis]